MRDWFGFKRRREQLRADVLAAVTAVPATSLDIARRIEVMSDRDRMVSAISVITTLHALMNEGSIKMRWTGVGAERRPEYWRNT